MAVRRFPVFKFVIAAVLLVAGLTLTRTFWLAALGRALVHDDGPSRADIAVVLGGDFWGNRIQTAGDLARAGYVPLVLVSGPPGFYDQNECDAAIQFAIHKGYRAAWFVPLPHNELNTSDESRALLEELKRRNIHRFLLVTSNYHTARARRIFLAREHAMGGGPQMQVVAAPSPFFKPDSWWRNREGQKIFFMEWLKTISGPLGI